MIEMAMGRMETVDYLPFLHGVRREEIMTLFYKDRGPLQPKGYYLYVSVSLKESNGNASLIEKYHWNDPSKQIKEFEWSSECKAVDGFIRKIAPTRQPKGLYTLEDYGVESYRRGKPPRRIHTVIQDEEVVDPRDNSRYRWVKTIEKNHRIWGRFKDWLLGRKIAETAIFSDGTEVSHSYRERFQFLHSFKRTYRAPVPGKEPYVERVPAPKITVEEPIRYEKHPIEPSHPPVERISRVETEKPIERVATTPIKEGRAVIGDYGIGPRFLGSRIPFAYYSPITLF